jgi:hypothetical protein
VCMSGTLRTFVSSSVRKRFVAAMQALAKGSGGGGGGGRGGGVGSSASSVSSGGGSRSSRSGTASRRRRGQLKASVASDDACGVELLAHAPLPSDGAVPWASRQWADDGSGWYLCSRTGCCWHVRQSLTQCSPLDKRLSLPNMSIVICQSITQLF